MSRFYVDSDTFIQAKEAHYAFDIVPAFWDCLDRHALSRALCSPILVYEELVRYNDELARWAKDRIRSGLFVNPDRSVQKTVTQIADYVNARYPSFRAAEFLEGADPWVIAHAKVEGGIVVTHEKLVDESSRKAKIPNVCRHFDVPYIDCFQMIRSLKVRFILEPIAEAETSHTIR